ncbi:uncharacterized protein LOC116345400 [Contarinia nasturtii]|uniref:uncharacterized protein LOC116345400 n=1 Tax=Contarinia nasturtii TaxID=265458 RepID=UPI0012D48E12|nr:uncharacterized protein LOC116345400 [Contarinia nasturtii]
MGHHNSKHSQQMPDDQQMTNKIEEHGRSSSTARDLQAKIGKNRQKPASASSNAKKLKKEQHQPSTKSSITNTSSGNKERNAGSVVITIRLLKMESAKNVETITIDDDDEFQTDTFSNKNYSSDVTHTQCESDFPRHYVNVQDVNRTQNQNASYKLDNNNGVLNKSDIYAPMCTNNIREIDDGITVNNFMICDIGNSGEMEQNICSTKNQHVNCALRSEAKICDKNLANYTSQSKQPSNMVNPLTQTFNKITLTDATQSEQHLPQTNNANTMNLINTVSPYPHHIPIANIRSDCLNTAIDEHFQQAKNGESCCEKHNLTSKDTKELKSKKPNWSIKLNCAKLKGIKSLSSSFSQQPSTSPSSSSTMAKNSDNSTTESNNVGKQTTTCTTVSGQSPTTLLIDNSALIVVTMDQQDQWYPDATDDCDKKARLQRALEIAEGVEPPPGFISSSSVKSLNSMTSSNLQVINNMIPGCPNKVALSNPFIVCSNSSTLKFLLQHADDGPRIHSQADYIHCLVPDLKQITNCSFYWGKMDRYEAERLLENKPEGTFLLRDSAQEEFLFSVSFRKYGRSLHARIEQYNHNFSFDCHDPGVYTSKTVTGLLEHYKDPACVMFFEPALTLPLNRNFVFSLQQLCRATIVSHTTYDGINEMCLPIKLVSYLKEYHYKQLVKVKKFDESIYSTT